MCAGPRAVTSTMTIVTTDAGPTPTELNLARQNETKSCRENSTALDLRERT